MALELKEDLSLEKSLAQELVGKKAYFKQQKIYPMSRRFQTQYNLLGAPITSIVSEMSDDYFDSQVLLE